METVDVYVKKLGKGPPVVILHGLFGASDNWQTLAKKLSEDYTVYLIDQRNHGRSPHHPTMNYQAMAADLNAFLTKENIVQPVLIGHSMGGKTVMTFALQYPDFPLAGIISVDMGIKKYQGDHTVLFETMLSMPIETFEKRNEAADFLGARIKDQGVLFFLLKNIQRKPTGGFEWKINLPVLWNNYDLIMEGLSETNSVGIPTLFLYGEASNYILQDDFDEIRQLFKRATFQGVPNAGHWVHAEKPVETLHAFRQFLESVFFAANP